MRLLSFLAVFVCVLGAVPAPAQEGRVAPLPKQPEAAQDAQTGNKHAHRARHAARQHKASEPSENANEKPARQVRQHAASRHAAKSKIKLPVASQVPMPQPSPSRVTADKPAAIKSASIEPTPAKPAEKKSEDKKSEAAAKPSPSPVPIPQPAPSRAAADKPGPVKSASIEPVPAKPAEKKSEDKKSEAVTKPSPSPVPIPQPAPSRAAVDKPATTKSASIELPKTKLEPKKAAAAEPDALAAVPSAQRLKIRSALLWAGDYPATASDGDPVEAAIKNFQKRHKAKVTGVLTPSERSDLVAAADAHEREFGWSVVTDPATGIRIGLPTKLVPHAREAAHGTHWSSRHGDVQVETFRIKDAKLKLSDLFEREKKQPSNRQIESSALHDDSFYLGGMQGLKYFAVRAYQRDGEVRGFTLLYDQMMEGIVAPVTSAMVSAFSPFPERSMPFAVLAKPVDYGNGLVVSREGHIVTDLGLTRGCQVIVAAGLGNAEHVVDDDASGLALLRVYGQRDLTPVSLAADASSAGDVTLAGIPDPKEQSGGRKLREIKARLRGSAVELRQPVPMAGFSGAAAIDGQGRFLGMLEMRSAVLASTEPAAPPVRLVTAAKIGDFLAAHHIKTATAPGADAKGAVVRVICVRK